jgi:ribosomal protein L19E
MNAEFRKLVLRAVTEDDKPVLRAIEEDALSELMEDGVIRYSGNRWWLTRTGAAEARWALAESRHKAMEALREQHRARMAHVKGWSDEGRTARAGLQVVEGVRGGSASLGIRNGRG